jgi:HSP20 family protein
VVDVPDFRTFDNNALRYYVVNGLNKAGGKKKMRLIPYFRSNEVPATNRLFEEFFEDFPLFSYPETRNQWNPAVDILEKDGNLVLRAELPGMTEKQIELKVEGDTLILKGERKMDFEDKKESYRRVESCYGSFTRSFRLPDTVDLDKISADCKNGVLTVTLPHKPEVKPREIPVSVN